MNYRHAYHAGNLADVVKHLTLCTLITRMAEKVAPICFFDTHAGAGIYDLQAAPAQKTNEAAAGVLALRQFHKQKVLQPLQQVLAAFPARFYPGSPAIFRHYLRPRDHLILIEKHPEDAALLTTPFHRDTRIHIHCRDGWEALQALIPPREKRLLVLIDPPYERSDDIEQAIAAMIGVQRHMPQACFALWYPIKDLIQVGHWHEQVAGSGIKKILRAEMFFKAPCEGLFGSGMLLITPPWQIEQNLAPAYVALKPLLAADAPAARIDWLVEE